jgi:hypothetical protein
MHSNDFSSTYENWVSLNPPVDGCPCLCHRQPGVMHFVPCCGLGSVRTPSTIVIETGDSAVTDVNRDLSAPEELAQLLGEFPDSDAPTSGESPSYAESANRLASAAELTAWAYSYMSSRAPDVIIGPVDEPYLLRWWVVPKNAGANIYLHQFLRSDEDRALHDHPSDNASLVLAGGYMEHTPDGVYHRQPGDFVQRRATDSHRVELLAAPIDLGHGNVGEQLVPAVSLFITQGKRREWGFWCDDGVTRRWVHWKDFVSVESGGKGLGCGDPAELQL